MAEISFGGNSISRMFFGDKTVAKIYAGTEEIYNGVMTIRFQKGDYINKIYRTGTSTDISSAEVPKGSTVYQQSGGTLHIIAPYEYDRTYNASINSSTAQYEYAFGGWAIYNASDQYIQDVPTSAGTAYTLQDGYMIKPYGGRSLKTYNLTVTSTGSGTPNSTNVYNVYYGSTINPTANGSVGSGYAQFTITPPSEVGGSATTITIPVTVLPSGDTNFGYYYYTYSWDTGSFTLTASTTITVTGTQVARTYTVNIRTDGNLAYYTGDGEYSTTSESFSRTATQKFGVFSDGSVQFVDHPSDDGGAYDVYPNVWPSRFGFDYFNKTFSYQELGKIMQNDSSSTLNITAYSKVVWVKKNTSVDSYTFTFSHDSASNSATITGMPSLDPSYIYLTMHYTKTGIGATDVTEDYEFYSNETIQLKNRGYILGTITKRSGSSGTLILDYTFNTYQLSNTNIEITVTGVYGPA